MTSDEILDRIVALSGTTKLNIIQFCKNYSIAYVDLNNWFTKFKSFPNIEACAKIRSFGSVYINSL